LWKILPLLLLVIFARPAINGVRDGLIYGALGGLGFGILEMAAQFALIDYLDSGWTNFSQAILGKLTFLGTDLHVIFSAVIGAAIGYGVTSKHPWKKYLVPIGAYVLVAATHDLQDNILKLLLPAFGVEIFMRNIMTTLTGLTVEQLAPMLETNKLLFNTTLIFAATFNLVFANIINLPILFWALWTSGDEERRVVREQLKDEAETIITPSEYSGVMAEKRLHLRSISGYPQNVSKKIRGLQNELAFRKEYVLRMNGDIDTDPPVQAIREEIVKLRAASNPTA
jgi:protease PrsW